MFLFNLNSLFWRICEDHIYALPEPPKRSRPKDKPMQVLCVGPPRSATESLQTALLTLGYDHTYHGWDIVFEQPLHAQQWVKLAKKKWYGNSDGDCHISAQEFDEILGHCVAVTDAAASCFAAEMIEAYPEAKVILNTRSDLDKWHTSAVNTLCGVQESWSWWGLAFFNAELFWSLYSFHFWLWPAFFRFPGGALDVGIRRNGKWVYREHCNMVRGLVPKERLLEWSVEDGWEPLCKFLGKEVPNEPFPNVNNAAGFEKRGEQANKIWAVRAYRNMSICGGILVAMIGASIYAVTSRL